VRSVNLRVARGNIHAMIGPNGAGKTTCFNLLSKFLEPTRGRIVFDGRDITALKLADVARMGPVRSFQISAVFPHLTTIENVRIALQRRRGGWFDFWRSKRVLHALDMSRIIFARSYSRTESQESHRLGGVFIFIAESAGLSESLEVPILRALLASRCRNSNTVGTTVSRTDGPTRRASI
jgi:ABC-type uncharacterized transport system ATPase subunit